MAINLNRSDEARLRIRTVENSLFDTYSIYYYVMNGLQRIADKKRSGETVALGFDENGRIALFYDEDFVVGRSDRQLTVVLLHNVLHLCFGHLQRSQGKDKQIFDIASDLVVNHCIGEIETAIQKGSHEFDDLYYRTFIEQQAPFLSRVDFRNTPVEEVYRLLKQNLPPESKNEKGKEKNPTGNHDEWENDTGSDDEEDDSGDQQAALELTDLQKQNLEDLVREAVLQAAKNNLKPGNLPGLLKRKFTEILEVEVDWRRYISAFPQTVAQAKKEPTWRRLHRRLLMHNVYWKGKKKSYRPNILVAIDNSGSIDESLYNEFVSHVVKIASSCDELVLIGCDQRVNFESKIVDLRRGKPPSFKDFNSGGGTLFQPVFDFARDEKFDGIIYLTDGQNFDKKKLDNYRIHTIFGISRGGTDVPGFRNIPIGVKKKLYRYLED